MRAKVLAVALVAVIVMAGAGIGLLYVHGEEALRERDDIAARQEMLASLSMIQSGADEAFQHAYRELTNASAALRATGLEGERARAVLSALAARVPHAVDAVTVNTSGIIVTAMPEEYQDAEGVDISDQPQVRYMLDHKMPVMSDVFIMVEGFAASDFEVPVFDGEGRFNGSVSVTLDISGMMMELVERHLDLDRFQFTCLQIDGTESYDTDDSQIGRNLFTDPAYQNHTAVLETMERVVTEGQGYATYRYYRTLGSEELVDKETYWASTGMFGASWRLMVIRAL